MYLDTNELPPRLEELQLDEDADADQRRLEAAHEVGGGAGGAAGREHVVDDDDAVAAAECIVMDLQRVGAVLQDVLVAAAGPGELARLADGDEAGAEEAGDAAAEDETARLEAGHGRDSLF